MSDDRLPTRFDAGGFRATLSADPSARPAFPLPTDYRDLAGLETFLDQAAQSVLRPAAALGHPYLVPGAIYNSLWTWDAYFLGLGLLPDGIEHFAGSLFALLERVDPDGRPPSRVDADGTADYTHVAQPIHAQWALTLLRHGVDPAALRPYWSTLTRIRTWWDATCLARRGLYSWIDGSGTGIDNDPASYTRPGGSVALVDVNCFQFRELSAMAELAGLLGDARSAEWSDRAEGLRAAVEEYLWDPAAEAYFPVDLTERTWQTFQEPTWEVQLNVQTWACLFPLWSGLAHPTRADRVIVRHVLEPDRFLSGFGIRSTPRDRTYYNNVPMGNPSNWQGPVWGLSTFLVCYGLARYGYTSDAIRISDRLLTVFATDLRHNGTIHEFYDADSGAPAMNPGFLSWNLLARRVRSDLVAGIEPTGL